MCQQSIEIFIISNARQLVFSLLLYTWYYYHIGENSSSRHISLFKRQKVSIIISSFDDIVKQVIHNVYINKSLGKNLRHAAINNGCLYRRRNLLTRLDMKEKTLEKWAVLQSRVKIVSKFRLYIIQNRLSVYVYTW